MNGRFIRRNQYSVFAIVFLLMPLCVRMGPRPWIPVLNSISSPTLKTVLSLCVAAPGILCMVAISVVVVCLLSRIEGLLFRSQNKGPLDD